MYKNQLQELAQRSCFNLPSYACVREGPDHAPRFKATVNFNGEVFESPTFCTTLRQAEHSAAEVALTALASRGPPNSLAARVLDETGVYKNLLQEVSQRVGASLPAYTTFRSGLGHLPVFTCIVELAGVTFTGEPAKNKKQAEKNAAMAAWSSLKLLAQQSDSSLQHKANSDEQEHVTVARALQIFLIKARLARAQFPIEFPTQNARPSTTQQSSPATSKILPFIRQNTAPRSRPVMAAAYNSPRCPRTAPQSETTTTALNETRISWKTPASDGPSSSLESQSARPLKFPAAGAAPYIPVRHLSPYCGVAPPVTIRNAIPVFSAPPLPPPSQSPQVMRHPSLGMAAPVCIRQAVPVYAVPPVQVEERSVSVTTFLMEPHFSKVPSVQVQEKSGFNAPPVQVKELSVSKAIPDQVQKPASPKVPTILVEEPAGPRLPSLGVEEVQVVKDPLLLAEEESISRVPIASSPASPTMPVEESGIITQEKLQSSDEVESLKQLKI